MGHDFVDHETRKKFDDWMKTRDKVHNIILSSLTVKDLEEVLTFLGVSFDCGPHDSEYVESLLKTR